MAEIIGRAKVIAETVVDEQQARKAGTKAGDAAAEGVAKGGDSGGKTFSSNFEDIVGKSLPLAAVGVGAAVGTVLAQQIGKNLQREAVGARFAASLGVSGDEAAELGKASADIYADAWGASFEAVQAGVAATKSSFRDLRGEELTEAALNAQIFSDIFAIDVVEAAGVASVAVKQGLAKDAVEAFDLMTKAAQQVPIQFRGELLEAITEYSQFFNQIGIDGPEAFALLAEGAALGQYGIDKTGDAIKEFGIRAIDTSATTIDAFRTLNLDLEATQTAIAGGGDAAEEAFRKIVQGLDNIEDPAEQAQTAIALFGTPIEDLGNEQLPVFITALANGSTGLQDFEGATKDAGKEATTFSGRISSLARKFDVEMGKGIDDIIFRIRNFIDALKDAKDASDNYTPGQQDGLDLLLNPGGSASGGRIGAGLRLVGENGPEIIQMGSGGGYVHNNSETSRMLGGDTRGGDFNYYNFGPVSGSDILDQYKWANRFSPRFGALSASVAG